MKKIFSLLAIVSICGVMIAGCGNASKSDKEIAEATENPAVESSETKEDTALSDDISPEFKEAMDSFEDFFNKYCEFMEKYKNSNDQANLISDYTDYMKEYGEVMEKLNAINSETLTSSELAYYTEVNMRITQKLAEVAN